MSTLNFEVFEAFKDAGVSEEKARRAAEALCDVHADRRLLRLEWMVGGLYGLITLLGVPVFLKVMFGG